MPAEGYVLGFDTSAAHCAAALLRAGQPVAERREEMSKGQAERLMPLLEELLACAGIGWHDLAAIGVGTGPGNFTGVRISVAAARGLALSLGIPAIGVSTLEALAEGLARPVTVVEDARRGEVYLQSFTAEGAGAPALLALTELPAGIAGHALTGSAAALAYSEVQAGELVEPAMPLAEAIARIAARRAGTPQPRPAPLYLRSADAAPPSDPPPVILD